jgi:hypothetical protein
MPNTVQAAKKSSGCTSRAAAARRGRASPAGERKCRRKVEILMCDKSPTTLGLRGESAHAHQNLDGVSEHRVQLFGSDIVLGFPDELQRRIPSNSRNYYRPGIGATYVEDGGTSTRSDACG